MQVQVHLTLPVSAEDWHKLTQLQSICSLGSVKVGELGTLASGYAKDLSEKVAPVAVTEEPFTFEELSDDEKSVLDAAAESTHTTGQTLLLDGFSALGVGNKPPSIREAMVHYMLSNGRMSSRQSLIEHVKSVRTDMNLNSVSKGLDAAAHNIGVIKDHGMWTLPASL